MVYPTAPPHHEMAALTDNSLKLYENMYDA